MSGAPRLAVLIPCYNRPDRLARTLASLESSTSEFDVIVVDDGSRPPLTCVDRIGEHPVALHRLERNQGIEEALNAGLELILSRGYDYVARLDSGDIQLPGRFEAQLQFLDTHDDHALVGSACDFVGTDGTRLYTYAPPTSDSAIRKALHYNNVVIHPTMMLRARVLRELGGYSRSFAAAEDYDLVFRVARDHKVANLGDVFLRVEFDPGGISQSRRARQLVSRLRVQLTYFDPRSVHSYAGVLVSAGLLAVPDRAVLLAKRVASRVRL